ncbi:hypothetical protein EMPS_09691 [Entomortierella parvispora]|uniref:Uncharacterized protein n=1 Tax=Entomortierella parvispora TaxID=205924 RepID=A0A9P3M0L5_9FUNG|nr:hypothetical protein EMPS_09691 [Entomortierella parvispora]
MVEGPDFITIGVDPGRAKPASVVVVHTKYPNLSQTLDIADKTAKDIQKRYMKCLNSKKKAQGIDVLEGTLAASVAPVQVKARQERGITTRDDWARAASVHYSNHLVWLKPRLAAFKKLRAFYESIDFKKDLFDLKASIRNVSRIRMVHIPHPKIPDA